MKQDKLYLVNIMVVVLFFSRRIESAKHLKKKNHSPRPSDKHHTCCIDNILNSELHLAAFSYEMNYKTIITNQKYVSSIFR